MKQLLGKVKNSFKPDKDPTFFGRIETGEIVFYPWGRPGEGIVLSANKANKVSFFMRVFSCIVLFYIALSMCADFLDLLNQRASDFLYLFFTMTLVPTYAAAIYWLKRDEKFFLLPLTRRPIRSGKYLAVPLMLITFLHVAGMGSYFVGFLGEVGYDFNPSLSSIAFIIVYIFEFFFSVYLFVKISKTRGYFFSK